MRKAITNKFLGDKKMNEILKFHYKQFADLIAKLEEESIFWQIQYDNAGDQGRILLCLEEMNVREKEIEKVYEVAGMLGLSKDILESSEKVDKKEALA
jgi:hypothetical protein